jgi:hypothetical protein
VGAGQLRARGIDIAVSTVQRWLRDLGLHRRAARLAILEDRESVRRGC